MEDSKSKARISSITVKNFKGIGAEKIFYHPLR